MGAAFSLSAEEVRGNECWAPSTLFPNEGALVSPQTRVWAICPVYKAPCAPPELRPRSGAPLELDVLQQRGIGPGGRTIVLQYGPRTALTPGEYELSQWHRPSLRFRVIESVAQRPRVPTVTLRGFTMAGSPDQHAEERGNYERSADFLVQGDPGLPVAEIGEGEKDPLYGLSEDFRAGAAGEYFFAVGWGQCFSTLAGADDCTKTRVRFGTLSGEGEFSGWSEWIGVQFPGTGCEAKSVDARRKAIFGWTVAGAAVCSVLLGGYLRFRRRHSGS